MALSKWLLALVAGHLALASPIGNVVSEQHDNIDYDNFDDVAHNEVISQILATRQTAQRPPAFFLAGDSTTAPLNNNDPVGGGWGDFFDANVNTALGATGKNMARPGADTKTFVSKGNWAWVKGNATQARSQGKDVYVTIQLGTNDQLPQRGISPDQFQANLRGLAMEIVALGATPILISPITKRQWDTSRSPPFLYDDLAEYAQRAMNVAVNNKLYFVDLHKRSKTYVQAIGPQASWKYNRIEGDWVHLNLKGGEVFGRMMSDLVVKNIPALDRYIKKNAVLSDKIWAGIAA